MQIVGELFTNGVARRCYLKLFIFVSLSIQITGLNQRSKKLFFVSKKKNVKNSS